MQDKTNLDRLSEKVTQILEQYRVLQSENEVLEKELTAFKNQEHTKDQEISKLKEENLMKDLEIEEIVNKIESILG